MGVSNSRGAAPFVMSSFDFNETLHTALFTTEPVSWEEVFYPKLVDWTPILAVAAFLYMPVVFGLMEYTKKWQQGYRLRIPLFLWNVGLATFSIIGSFKLFPHLLANTMDKGFAGSVCDTNCYY